MFMKLSQITNPTLKKDPLKQTEEIQELYPPYEWSSNKDHFERKENGTVGEITKGRYNLFILMFMCLQ